MSPRYGTLARTAALTLALCALGGCVSLDPAGEPARPTSGPGSLPLAEDADGDGVADAKDACRSTRVLDAVDERGCSPFEGVLDGVDFASGGSSLSSSAREALAPLARALGERPEVRLEIQGHTDNRGPAAGNLVLSKRRVMAVVRYLVAEGVAPSRLEPWGYGENRPIASNATPEGRARNRRIEVRALAP